MVNASHQAPDMPGLHVRIRRAFLLEDGLAKLYGQDLRKKIHVHISIYIDIDTHIEYLSR